MKLGFGIPLLLFLLLSFLIYLLEAIYCYKYKA